jgi:hypothetical protein
VFIAQRAQIATLAAESRRPAVYTIRDFVDVGGLMSYVLLGEDVAGQLRMACLHCSIAAPKLVLLDPRLEADTALRVLWQKGVVVAGSSPTPTCTSAT